MTDPSFVEQATPYLVSGVVAMAALMLGRWLERRDSHAAWLRERQLAAYTEFLQLSHDAWRGVAHLYIVPWTDSHRTRLTNDVDVANLQMGRAASMIEMLGPAEVHQAAEHLSSAFDAAFQMVRDERLLATARTQGHPLNTQEGKALLNAERLFVRAARQRVTR